MTESTALARGNQSDLARRLGVSRQAVSQMVKKGIVQVEPDGKILLDEAEQNWHSQVDVRQQRPFKGTGSVPKAAQIYRVRYHMARTRRAWAEAKLAEMALANKKAELLDAQELRKAFADAAQKIRIHMLKVAPKVAAQLVGLQSETEIADKLYQELESTLLALSENVF